jgi:hypothetical protein
MTGVGDRLTGFIMGRIDLPDEAGHLQVGYLGEKRGVGRPP